MEDMDKQAKSESENVNMHNDFTSTGTFRRNCIMAEETREIRTKEHLGDF